MGVWVGRVIWQGGNLMVTIPRALARELGLRRRDYVTVARGPGRSVRIEKGWLEHVDDRPVPEDQRRPS